MAATELQDAFDSALELACFEIGGNVYGVDVLQIREIVRAQEVTSLPKAPELIEGVIELRGQVIPVVDLGRILGGTPTNPSPAARIAVLEVDDMVIGLRVQLAVDVISATPASIASPPALATNAGYDVVRALVKRTDAPSVLVLSTDHLLEAVYRSAALEPESTS